MYLSMLKILEKDNFESLFVRAKVLEGTDTIGPLHSKQTDSFPVSTDPILGTRKAVSC